jgi:hypothetical protein
VAIQTIDDSPPRLFRTIVVAWLLAGTMDIAAAIFVYAFPSAASMVQLLQGIASGLLGAAAFSGGLQTAAVGVMLHYVIALIWTLVAFFIFNTFRNLTRHLVVAGVAYGVVVWAVMNLIVVPLSRIGSRPLHFVPSLIAATILIFCIGLPVALVIGRALRGAPPSER